MCGCQLSSLRVKTVADRTFALLKFCLVRIYLPSRICRFNRVVAREGCLSGNGPLIPLPENPAPWSCRRAQPSLSAPRNRLQVSPLSLSLPCFALPASSQYPTSPHSFSTLFFLASRRCPFHTRASRFHAAKCTGFEASSPVSFATS